jgi:glycosyltransferase involved in cell wall biosynthesis
MYLEYEMKSISRFLPGNQKPVGELIRQADRLRDLKQWQESAECYQAVLEIDPKLPHIWVQYGHSLKEGGNPRGAQEAYERALALDETADTYLQLGHLQKLLGRTYAAEQYYINALQKQPDLRDAKTELARLGWSTARLQNHVAASTEQRKEAVNLTMAFELSDLVDYLQGSRYPTGIQRVQLALASAIANSYDEDAVAFVYYDHARYVFVELDRAQLDSIIDLVEYSARPEASRAERAAAIKHHLLYAEEYAFPTGCTLINLGTSWGYSNYFLSVRDVKRRYGVWYVPLVHDCIPLLFPEFCDQRLVFDYINWIANMIDEVDILLVNSENTGRDVLTVGGKLRVELPKPIVMRLNGQSQNDLIDSNADGLAQELLRAHNLDASEFVLFVSTIEPRKNHHLALNAWSRLIKRSVGRKIPRLVCVGNSGWMNEGFYQRLARDPVLAEHVVILHNISEQALKLLYQRCLFTIFPSLYEGWGLPISEALANGKVPLVSDISSHREAGGDLAVYFNLESESDFHAKLEDLMFDGETRNAHEKRIAAASPLRPWSQIATELVAQIESVKKSKSARDGGTLPVLKCDHAYSFGRNTSSRLDDILHSGDAFRRGLNWHAPEPWGCWGSGTTGDLTFRLLEEDGQDFVAYLLLGSSTIENCVTLSVPAAGWFISVSLAANQQRWQRISLRLEDSSKREVTIRLSSETIDDLSNKSGGKDPRRVSVAIKAIYVCRADNISARQELFEAITLGNWEVLARQFQKVAVL